MRMGKWGRITAGATLLAIIGVYPTLATQLAVVDEFTGLQRNPESSKIQDKAHSRFDNAFIHQKNLRVIKGRDRLNDTAFADPVHNGFFYYENFAGTSKQLVIKETDEIVIYGVNGAGRTQIASGLTNEPMDCVQVENDLYCNSSTDGLLKWTGSGSMTAVVGVSAPSAINFVSSTTVGGMTPGFDILVLFTPATVDSTCNTNCDGATAISNPCRITNPSNLDGTGQTGDVSSATVTTAATSTTYQYKVTKSNSEWKIESQPSTADSVSLTGSDTYDYMTTGCLPCDTDHTDISCDESCCNNITAASTGALTSTSGTIPNDPGVPFNEYCMYRTVASGSEYFLVGCTDIFTGTFKDGKPDVSLGVTLDTTIDTITPPSFRYIDEFKGILFTAEGNEIRFSNIPVNTVGSAEQYWLETDQLQTSHNKTITGLHTTTDSILVFTENRIIEITGFGAESFRQRILLEGIGAISDATIKTDSQGDIIFFAGIEGVYKLRTFAQPQDDLTGSQIAQDRVSTIRISSPFLNDIFRGVDDQIDLDPADYQAAHGYYDRDNDLYFLYIDEHAFIFDNINESWSHVPATKMSGSLYRKSPNASGQGVLVDNLGYLYDNFTGYENGVESGTVTGNPTSSASTTLTDTGATFNTTLDGLSGAWVTADCSDTLQNRRISSNTATILTIDTAWTSNPTTACTYYIGYLVFDITTKQYSLSSPPREMITQSFTIVGNPPTSAQNIKVRAFIDKSTIEDGEDTKDLSDGFVTKILRETRGLWTEWNLRSFVYNTSNTIDPPVDIINYSFRSTERDED